MARSCPITGKKTRYGNNVSHSHKKTRRNWKVNLMKKKFYIEEEDRWVTLKLSARGLKTINKKGVKKALKDADIKI